MFNHIFMEVFMKTLKVGALALGMMFAGSVMAMDEAVPVGQDVNWDYTTAEVVDVVDYTDATVTDAASLTGGDEPNAVLLFIKTHPKKLGLLAAVAVLTVAYVAYKKYTAKKKIQVEEEDEDEAVVTTVE
jgi:hypothetical protein